MRKSWDTSALALLLCFPCSAALTQEPSFTPGSQAALDTRIHQLLDEPAASHAHWGIVVTTLDGTPLYNLEANKLFRPASTAKLFTTAAAMALLGPDHRFTTTLYGNLDPATGVVQGDLTLLGGGDPSFATDDLPYLPASQRQVTDEPPAGVAALHEFVTALTSAGVKQITGNLLGDDALFEPPTVPEGWAEEDLLWGYGALPSALSFGDNEIRLTLTPKATDPLPGSTDNAMGALLTTSEPFPHLHVVNQVVTQSADKQHPGGIDAQALPGRPESIRLFGRLSPGAAPVHETIALDDPAAYAAGVLQALLQQHGIALKGEAKSVHAPPDAFAHAFTREVRTPGAETRLWENDSFGSAVSCPGAPHATHLIAQHTSPPLAQEIAFTLKTSANLHAEILLHHLGLLAACPGVTTLEGARVLHSWLQHIGVAGDDFMLYDGSGLSTKDLVTPRAEAQLLAYAARQPWFALWKAALPIGGVDGTLASRFTTVPLKGHVYAKTGTLGETRALAGYVQAASGQQRIVVILIDDHEPGSTADRTTMDAVVAAIAELE